MEDVKCLIVEDEFIIANNIKTFLQNKGYIVTSIVSSGEDAIESVKSEKPDIILMDIYLGEGIDGIEIAEQIHSFSYIPIIYITANVNDKLVNRAKITEPFGYLIKPFNEKELHITIELALYKHSMEMKLKELNNSLEKRVIEAVETIKQNELMLIQQSKMAAMGEMIGVIAHQWRQPLNGISLVIQDLEEAFNFGELDKEYIKKAVKSTMEYISFMSNTIDDFRNFFKPSKLKIPFSINLAAQEIIDIFYDLIKKIDIQLSLTCTSNSDLMVIGCPNEFKQAALNLIINAKDAIIEKRKRNLFKDNENAFISIELSKVNDMAVVKVMDNGGGIPTPILEKLFAPYITTKNEGTGIGLYMSKIIVERNMEGKLRAENIENGAMFVMEFKCNL
ncbi:MAG: response regulator [Nitrospirae bacterium]|nr:response regulator [Nitrospirota bacterium]